MGNSIFACTLNFNSILHPLALAQEKFPSRPAQPALALPAFPTEPPTSELLPEPVL
jgi:hypothetical protein